ncbi:uncharacterized protein LOC123547104 [Mercenaria mercenaria]|uniref:uncharacterized protein LOC123547104 n=1 Tax=Mercenaria mercenaria TaxID=6596 RepID=UPI00234F2734|nr:uncharacterized protein LOC123547104 [Mercenaria mercenaria]
MDVTKLKKTKYIENIEETVSEMKDRKQCNLEEPIDIEFYETITPNKEIYENLRIVQPVLDKTNSGPGENYESLKIGPKQEHKVKAAQYVCMTESDTKQKAVLLILSMTGVILSSVSLVISSTAQERAEAVDGTWSGWSLWEACSTTCDVGIQRRHRNCSNPVPLGNGRQCLGLDNEHRLCMSGSCTNGGWSAWGSWGSCSASCNVGRKTRFRTCTNPRPSLFGDFCEGENTQVEICGRNPCNDGGWSAWRSWGSCSASCNVGLKSRFRTCTNPRPSLFGDFCEGENTQVEICGRNPCKETRVAFNVYQSSAKGTTGSHTVIFTSILLNEGEAYNQTDGIFTAPFSGLYQFNGQICTVVGEDADYTLTIEGKSFASGEYRTPSEASDGKCTSFSAVVSVLKDQRVWITSQHLFANGNDWNSFSGILIHKT